MIEKHFDCFWILPGFSGGPLTDLRNQQTRRTVYIYLDCNRIIRNASRIRNLMPTNNYDNTKKGFIRYTFDAPSFPKLC